MTTKKNFNEEENEEYDIPSVLNQAIEGEDGADNDYPVFKGETVSTEEMSGDDMEDVLRDIDGNKAISSSGDGGSVDMFTMMEIKNRDLDFQFKQGCATCMMALDDPQIHETYRKSGNIKDVERYMIDVYSEIQKVPTYDSIANHINKHFWPVEVRKNEDIIRYKTKVKEKNAELATLTRESEIGTMKAMTWVIMEDLASTNKNSKTYLESVRMYNQTAKTALQLAEHELKLLGADGNTPPEVMEKRIKNYLTQLISTAKEEDPDMAKKLVGLLQKVNLPTE